MVRPYRTHATCQPYLRHWNVGQHAIEPFLGAELGLPPVLGVVLLTRVPNIAEVGQHSTRPQLGRQQRT